MLGGKAGVCGWILSAYHFVVTTVHVLSCLAGCEMAVGARGVRSRRSSSSLLFVFLFSFLVLVFGVVRAQLCEHARYPRTPLCPPLSCSLFFLLFSLFSSLPAFLHSHRLSFCWNGGG